MNIDIIARDLRDYGAEGVDIARHVDCAEKLLKAMQRLELEATQTVIDC